MTTKTPQDPPKIEFPCENYPIKVVGRNSGNLKDIVIEVVSRFAPDFDTSTVSLHDSSKGTFQSVRFSITATGEPQLKAIHEALKETGQVNMVI